MEYYVFKKPGFKKRQSAKLKDANKRWSILWSCDANYDPKIMALHAQRDHSLLPMFIEILSNLDLETETWEVSKLHFDLWAQRTFGNNRFNVLKRLRWLSENGFIEFSEYSDKPLQDVTEPLANISQDSCKGLANISQDSCKGLANISQDSCKGLANSLQDAGKGLPNGVREGENPHHSTRDLNKTKQNKHITPTPLKGERAKNKTLVAEDWQPAEKFQAWLASKHPWATQQIFQDELDGFKRYCKANNKLYADHYSALQNWFDSPIQQKKYASGSFGQQPASKPSELSRYKTYEELYPDEVTA